MLTGAKKLISILLIISSLFMLVGCGENEEKENPQDGPSNAPSSIPENTPEEDGPLTLIQIDEKLYNYAIEVYKNKSYEKYPKTNGEYKISLNQLEKDLGYDVSMFIHPDTKEVCDKDKTAVVIDIDNVRKVEYTEYPIMIEVYCS